MPLTIMFREKKKDLLQLFSLFTNVHLVNQALQSFLIDFLQDQYTIANHKRTEKHVKDPKNEG